MKNLKSIIALLVLTVFSVNVWGETLFYEDFGNNSSNVVYSSASLSATEAMFTSGSATTNYTGDGKAGKNTTNPSTTYTGASGNSGAWYQAQSGTSTHNIIQIDNIKITGYQSLQLSFGAFMTNGASSSNALTVYYKIDDGAEKTATVSNLPTSTSTWQLATSSLTGKGTTLRLRFSLKTTGGYTYRLDDIKITGTPACTAPDEELSISATSTSIALNKTTGISTTGGNGGAITYKVTTTSGSGTGKVENGVFSATATGTYKVSAHQDLTAGGVCEQDADVTITVTPIVFGDYVTQCCISLENPLTITPIDPMKKNEEIDLEATGGNGSTIFWSTESNKIELTSTGHVKALGTGEAVVIARQEKNGDVCDQVAQIIINIIPASMFGVTMSADEGGTAKAYFLGEEVTTAETDDVVTITAEADGDHNFTGWEVLAGEVELGSMSEASTTFKMGSANVQIKAHFAIKQYTITLDAGNGTVDDESTIVLENQDIHSKIALPNAVACNSDEWEFKGWATSSVTETTTEPTFVSSTEYEVTDNITLYAVYGQGEAIVAGYTISFIDKDNTRQYATGGVSNKVFPVTSNASNAQIFHVSSINQDEATSLTYEGAGGAIYYVYRNSSNDFAAAISVPENATVRTWKVTSNSITGVENTTRGIAGRNASGTTVAAIKDYAVSSIGTDYAPIIVEAVYEEGGVWNSNPSCTHHYQVTYDGNGATTSCTSEKLEEGEITLCATEPEKAGYTFAGWNDGMNTYAAGAKYNLTAPVTFTAVWNPIKVTAITLNVTEPQTLNWKSDLASAPTSQLSVASTTPAAVADNSVTWSVSEGTAVSVSATGLVTAVEAGTATITATANDGSNVKASCVFTVTKTYKLTITDTEGVYDIKANTSQTKNQYHEAAEEITLSGTTKGGYIFGEWVVMQGETPITVTNNKFTMPTAEVTVTATFTTKKDYYVDDMNDNAQIVMEGKYTVPSLPDVVTPTSSNSCEQTHLYFVGWIEGDIGEGQTDMPTGLITAGTENKAASGKTYHAVWAEDANNNQ